LIESEGGIRLDPQTIEMLKSCRKAGFPQCLEAALVKIFKDKQIILSVAAKAGYETHGVNSTRDVWEVYLKFLASLQKELGDDIAVVIEFQTLNEIERLSCVQCPIYAMEEERMKNPTTKLPLTAESLETEVLNVKKTGKFDTLSSD
jgi:hypothetical protein